MKILLVTTVLHHGVIGPAKFARYLYERQDIDVDVLVENEEPADNVVSFPVRLGWFSRKLSVYNRIKRYQKQLLPICHQYDVVLFSSGILAYGLPPIPAIPMVMINDDNYLTAGLSLTKKGLIDRFYRHIERRLVENSNYLIVNSHYLKQKVVAEYGCAADNIHVLYKAASLPQSTRTSISWTAKTTPIRIFFVKNDYVRGGLLDLVEALAILSDVTFHLTVVGCQPTLPMVANVSYHIRGGLPNEEVLELMQTQHIYCVPSRREALGVANMEAMASGIPVVTTDAGGIPEVITEREGWIAKPADSRSLAAVLRRCILEPDLRAQKVMLAREKVKMFSADRMITRLKEIIEEVLAN